MIDNQFRPTPQSRILPAVFDALEVAGITDAVVVCANGKVFPMSESDTDQKIGAANLARMEANGWGFFQNDPRNADAYEFVGVSSGGTPVWFHQEVAGSEVKIAIGQAQANPGGAGRGGRASGVLGRLGRRRRSHPRPGALRCIRAGANHP